MTVSEHPEKPFYTLAQLADILGGELKGDPDVRITGLAPIQTAIEGQVSFLANAAYRKFLTRTQASLVLLRPDMAAACPVNCLILDNPYAGYARMTQLFDPLPSRVPGIHPNACVDPDADIADSAQIEAGAVIEAGVTVGERSIVGSHCYIGRHSILGADCRLHPNVTLYHEVVLEDAVTIHSNSVIGGDGFGFAPENGRWVKIAQLGGVIIGARSEIGSNTNIDRGALDNTEIGPDVIIDSQVQIAHNVRIAQGTAIAGCVGIAGSSSIGRYCLIGGACNIAGHLTICDGVTLTMATNVTGDIREPGHYSSGTAMSDTRLWRRNAVRFNQLDSLAKRVNKLEKNLSPGRSGRHN